MKDAKSGRFTKGTSGNPAGRPLGSRNKAMLACEKMLQDGGPALMQMVMDEAKKGKIPAMRLWLERIYPVRKHAPIEFLLQPIESAADLRRAFREVTTALSEGRITPEEAVSIARFLMIQAEALKTVALEQQVREIEKEAHNVSKFQNDLDGFIDKEIKLGKAEAAKQAAYDEGKESQA
jgi:hypothetical protein